MHTAVIPNAPQGTHRDPGQKKKKSSFRARGAPRGSCTHAAQCGQLSTQLGTAGGAVGSSPAPAQAVRAGGAAPDPQRHSDVCLLQRAHRTRGPTQLAQHLMGTVWEPRLNTSWPKFRKQSLLLSTTPYKYTQEQQRGDAGSKGPASPPSSCLHSS